MFRKHIIVKIRKRILETDWVLPLEVIEHIISVTDDSKTLLAFALTSITSMQMVYRVLTGISTDCNTIDTMHRIGMLTNLVKCFCIRCATFASSCKLLSNCEICQCGINVSLGDISSLPVNYIAVHYTRNIKYICTDCGSNHCNICHNMLTASDRTRWGSPIIRPNAHRDLITCFDCGTMLLKCLKCDCNSFPRILCTGDITYPRIVYGCPECELNNNGSSFDEVYGYKINSYDRISREHVKYLPGDCNSSGTSDDNDLDMQIRQQYAEYKQLYDKTHAYSATAPDGCFTSKIRLREIAL